MIEKSKKANWQKVLEEKVQPAFLAPWQDNCKEENFKEVVREILIKVNNLKGTKEDNKCFLGSTDSCIKNIDDIKKIKKEANMEDEVKSMEDVISKVASYFKCMFNWGHPKAMFNVLPPAAIPSIVGSLVAAMFNPNLVEQEYSGDIAALEIEAVSMVSKLLGYDSVKAGGHFTFGGTGAYLFAAKLALTKCLGKESREKGIREDVQILVSKVGHYAVKNCSDWTGLGTNNIRSINLNEDSSMDLNNLEEVMEQCYKEGKKVAMIVATMGTTDAFAIDNIKGISEICDRFVKKHNLNYRPFIYADAVIGWAWTVFNSYDFNENKMEFSKDTVDAIRNCCYKIKDINIADAVGIDFHKTGFTSYNCSMICIKDSLDLEILTRAKNQMAYLYQFSAYTPGEYTLECSRGGSYALSAWCNLKYFGLEGYRTLLGNLIESQISLRKIIEMEESLVCVNKDDYGVVTLFRVYPKALKETIEYDNFAKEQYRREFEDKDYIDDLRKYNEYQFKISQELQKIMFEENGPALSFTSQFRINPYGEPIAAIKAYPMSPYMGISEQELRDNIIKYLLIASENVDKKLND